MLTPLTVFNPYLSRLASKPSLTIGDPAPDDGSDPLAPSADAPMGGFTTSGVGPPVVPASAPAPPPKAETMTFGPMKSRPAPTNAIAESLIADSAGGVHSPWEALGKLSEFGVGQLSNRHFQDETAKYNSAPFDELRQSLASGKTLDEAMRTSSYPELWKLWLAREMNPKTTDAPNSYDEYVRTIPSGSAPTADGYHKFLQEKGASLKPPALETAEAAKIGGKRGDAFGKIADDSVAASNAISTLSAMSKLSTDDNFWSGPGGSKYVLPFAKTLDAITGGNLSASMTGFDALSKKAALDAMGGSLGTGFSNADRDFVVAQTANLDNTPAGNSLIIEMATRVARRKIQLAHLASEYISHDAEGNPLPEGQRRSFDQADFTDKVQAWADAHPLFEDLPGIGPKAATPDDGSHPPPKVATPDDPFGLHTPAVK